MSWTCVVVQDPIVVWKIFLNIVAEVFCPIKGAMIVSSEGIIRLARLRVIREELVSSRPLRTWTTAVGRGSAQHAWNLWKLQIFIGAIIAPQSKWVCQKDSNWQPTPRARWRPTFSSSSSPHAKRYYWLCCFKPLSCSLPIKDTTQHITCSKAAMSQFIMQLFLEPWSAGWRDNSTRLDLSHSRPEREFMSRTGRLLADFSFLYIFF